MSGPSKLRPPPPGRAPQTGRWPVREHLRPRQCRGVVTEADVDLDMLVRYPGLAEELNTVVVRIREPDGWAPLLVPLTEALAMPWAGEA